MESEVEAVMATGNMDVEAVHAMLMNLTPTKVSEKMKFIREDRDKIKGMDQDTAGIRVAIMAPDSAMLIITEG